MIECHDAPRSNESRRQEMLRPEEVEAMVGLYELGWDDHRRELPAAREAPRRRARRVVLVAGEGRIVSGAAAGAAGPSRRSAPPGSLTGLTGVCPRWVVSFPLSRPEEGGVNFMTERGQFS